MTVFTWILLIGVFVGIGWVWYRINTDKSGAISCCGCGQCAVSGECVMVKKNTKKAAPDLTNKSKQI